MEVRTPSFKAEQFRAQWAPNREFAQTYNASSIVPAHIEPYLIKVMTRSLKEVDPQHAELRREMEIFIKQETQHCKQHVEFNRNLHKGGYEGMLKIEQAYKNEYAHFLDKKSLKFNLAYCEGFEALGCASAEVWFSGALDSLLDGADRSAVDLWLWHLAEEFEHRTVCFDVFKTLYCQGFWNTIVNGYFYRVWAFLYAVRHIAGYTKQCSDYLIGKDNEGLSADELAASAARRKAADQLVGKATLPRLLKVLSPFYTPRRKQMPENMRKLLARFAAPAAAAA